MTQTIKVRNISGNDRDVPVPGGEAVMVPANHQHEFEADHARGLLAQVDVWERVKDAPPKPPPTPRTRTPRVRQPAVPTAPTQPVEQESEADAPTEESAGEDKEG